MSVFELFLKGGELRRELIRVHLVAADICLFADKSEDVDSLTAGIIVLALSPAKACFGSIEP
jgi:hypothetical protein